MLASASRSSRIFTVGRRESAGRKRIRLIPGQAISKVRLVLTRTGLFLTRPRSGNRPVYSNKGGSVSKLVSGALLWLPLAATAAGAVTGTVPEPGTFELLVLGGVVGLVLSIRNRRNKK